MMYQTDSVVGGHGTASLTVDALEILICWKFISLWFKFWTFIILSMSWQLGHHYMHKISIQSDHWFSNESESFSWDCKVNSNNAGETNHHSSFSWFNIPKLWNIVLYIVHSYHYHDRALNSVITIHPSINLILDYDNAVLIFTMIIIIIWLLFWMGVL